ncbi:hypothetical protein H3H37_22550 [Duganella sp. LX20W]|uniref:Uncharacterized protein n=1 Tax=Rugamonas brunnea TaxID=2758569 RepID=A0A7W2EWD3_9BURK|nr:hypothetical protein [Rugamonas brunnea]MBA5639843.1 hypothetical protein [Rugamonas brunnea]
MIQISLRLTVPLAAAAAALLTACASAPADTTVASAQPAAPVVKCRNTEAATGTSIVRKDCSATNNVSEVDPHDLMDSKRVALPNR